VVQDGRDRGLDPLDGGVPVRVERGAGGEPDVDAGGVAAGLARPRVDAGDGVLDHLGQEPGAGDDALADAAAEMQHARPLGADRDRDAGADGALRPPDALGAALIRRFPAGEQIAHAGHVVLDPGP
jgi:hypothetical protein